MVSQLSESTSVTVRIPNSILELIEARVNDAGGKGKRSEAIITLLKKALDQPVTSLAVSIEKVDRLEREVVEVKKQLEELSQSVDSVRHQVTRLDNNHKVEEVSKLMQLFELRLTAIESSKPNSGVSDERVVETTSKHIQLDISDNQLSDSGQELIEAEVVEIFYDDEEMKGVEPPGISVINPFLGKYLAKRLSVNESTISTKKSQLTEQELYEWLAAKDPDHIEWRPLGGDLQAKRKLWVPAEDTSKELLNKLQEWLLANPNPQK